MSGTGLRQGRLLRTPNSTSSSCSTSSPPSHLVSCPSFSVYSFLDDGFADLVSPLSSQVRSERSGTSSLSDSGSPTSSLS